MVGFKILQLFPLGSSYSRVERCDDVHNHMIFVCLQRFCRTFYSGVSSPLISLGVLGQWFPAFFKMTTCLLGTARRRREFWPSQTKLGFFYYIWISLTTLNRLNPVIQPVLGCTPTTLLSVSGSANMKPNAVFQRDELIEYICSRSAVQCFTPSHLVCPRRALSFTGENVSAD